MASAPPEPAKYATAGALVNYEICKDKENERDRQQVSGYPDWPLGLRLSLMATESAAKASGA